ncbi:LEAF RUST 10 DISEASE-RESISTANCE LOCUS RECEPTOR-LIKE PROTEIN KINASE-like 2.4 isoform X7 [Capsella rubella]|uniref:LEAF RUST 10 DISEASE-RESISTANCE LOCUS RECEPTOR-LIKE PROTEIN KINASE-like 2.4 isoform X7 n=1 Tax=Capsella rubella TaxID=81985 RepID=UPI000CD511D0|nr:LEAF RUST 10 DISEASE-RESISTANCE LOCUS RECEPTOR-LIKE PROTEIN KINASE-like 2.4 isoform X7 [Capsella rubella]
MYSLTTSCLVLFFLFFSFHPLPCVVSKEDLGWCKALFQCGNLTAGFPFWGGNRLKPCGHPLLELRCLKDGITSLSISNHEYNVFHIDQTRNTLRLARTDLLGSFCSAKFKTATLPHEIFKLSPTYKSLNVLYNCDPKLSYRSSYTCPDLGLFSMSQSLDYKYSCQDSFTVNVPTSFVPEEKELNLTNLESTLREGFEMKLVIDEIPCQECSSTQGICGFSSTTQVCCNVTSPSGGVSSRSLLPFLVLQIIVQIFRKRKTSDDRRQEKLKALIPLKHYTYAQVKKITKSFAEVVGKGGFGIVYKGTLCDGRMVAVKVLKESKGNNSEDFINEVSSMSQTSHVNIVSLLGFCSEGSKRAIIYEFLENGSLDKFISENMSTKLDLTTLYGIALGVARGLEYLHYGCKTRIVHFDIKPQNVLLDDNLSPKVSDFGLAKLCEKKESILSMMETRGTIGYIAPEMVSRVYGSVSHKSDVYSYGMLVFEMLGARKKERYGHTFASDASSMYFPEWIYKDLEKGDNEDLEKGNIGKYIGNGISSEEEELAKKMTLVGLWCIQSSPSNRPPMNRVVEMMEGNLGALEVPPRPVLQQIPVVPLDLESSWISEETSSISEIENNNLPSL